tara:strand:+ start:239 stop:541 length:303 start_codon:yes stop_codon:yes gene_type:complete
MVKSEIISKLSNSIHRKIKKSELEKILKIITNTIAREIRYKKSTEIRSFGRFSQKKIKEKKNARNPRTGEKIHTKEKISIIFKMSKELKNKINNNGERLS